VAGGSARRIGGVSGYGGTWSRDGRRIVFSHGSAVFQVNIDGTDCRKLVDTRNGISDAIRWAPAPGPDVLRLRIHNHDTGAALWEVASDGAGLHPLQREPASGGRLDNDYSGSWIPSGKYYLFLRSAAGGAISLWVIRENRDWLPVFGRSPVEI
jgi:Tol biopolymer transport system component